MSVKTVLLGIFLVIAACSAPNEKKEDVDLDAAGTRDTSTNTLLYPFPQFIEDQIAWLDSTPLAVERIIDINGIRTDSALIEKNVFKAVAAQFTDDDPNLASVRSQYYEESFEDLSMNTITFSISSRNPALRLLQADVLLNPETKKVKHVVLKRQLAAADSTEMQHVLWVANMKCQVSSVITKKDGSSYQRNVQYIWDRPIF